MKPTWGTQGAAQLSSNTPDIPGGPSTSMKGGNCFDSDKNVGGLIPLFKFQFSIQDSTSQGGPKE